MLDNTDKHILDELSKNGRITMKELGKKVHLTGLATTARVAKLEDSGIIEGYSIKINQEKLGYSIHAIISIITNSPYHEPYLTFLSEQKEYVINNYKISGDSCYLLECKFPSNKVLDAFLVGLSKRVNYKLSIVINK